MKRLILSLLLLCTSPAFADDIGANDEFKSIITHQLQAMAQDDAATAYSDAAPIVQQLFPTPDAFMNMVRNGYAPVYRNKSFKFEASGTDPSGRPYQRVGLVGVDGDRYEAIYYMQKQPDGSWKISGCVIVKDGVET
jgi:hypothetical protein